MNTQDEQYQTAQSAAHNPFPEPQTIPSGWDTSEFLSMPQPASSEEPGEAEEDRSK